MESTKNLVFFDKSGTNYGFSYNTENNLWEGAIYLNPVSKGLFETEKIIVMERYPICEESYEVDSHGILINPVITYEYGYPSTDYGNGDYYMFRWDASTNEVDEIQMYGFDKTPCEPEDTSALTFNKYNCPLIEYRDEVRITDLLYDPVDYEGDTVQDGLHRTTYRKNSSWSPNFACVDLSFCNQNDEYSTFRRDLCMYHVHTDGYDMVEELVGRFSVYAKSIEEDERLDIMCRNLGYSITNNDYSILMDSDIKEDLVDNDLMNTKRKEMLLEGHNIYSHVGSYKSLINAIRFFGYDNVSIREWWKNVDAASADFGKSFLATTYSLENRECIKGDGSVTLPSKRFRKLNRLSLAYAIDRLTGEENQNTWKGHSYPEAEESFTYTIEEAVIKLYGLKRKLDREFIPLNTRIIDITGEANAFGVHTLTHVFTANGMFDTRAGESAEFDILNGDDEGGFYISDLRPFGIHPTDARSGNGIVGESSPSVRYIGAGLQSLYSADEQDGYEFGLQGLQQYNTNFTLQDFQDVPISTAFQGILGIQGLGAETCMSVQQYQGIQGVNPPYEMYGENLLGVFGHTVDECSPWTFYPYEMERIGAVGNYYLADFGNYFPNIRHNSVPANSFDVDTNEYLPDEEGIPCGAVVRLKFKEREITWNECRFTWESLANGGIYEADETLVGYISDISWNMLNTFVDNRSRIEWSVYKEAGDTPSFYSKICGTFANGYGDIGIVLPYIGEYSVEMKVYDWNNNPTIKLRPNCISVMPREVEFTGWCRISEGELAWDSTLSWDELGCDWRFPVINDLTWNDMKSATYEAMDRATFLSHYVGAQDADESMMLYTYGDDTIGEDEWSIHTDHTGAYFWNNLDCTWNDLDHLWWDAMCITGDIPCYFEFGYFDENGTAVDSPDGQNDTLWGKWLEFVTTDNRYTAFHFPQGNQHQGALTDITDITRMLNNSSDPIVSMFTYSYVYDCENPNNQNGFKIVAVSKFGGKLGDLKHIGIVSTQYHAYSDIYNRLHIRTDQYNKQLRFHTNSVLCNPTWQDCVCINNVKRIPAWTDVNFNYSNCRICGKKNPRWKITNLNTGSVYTNSRKNFHRLFKEKGCYNVELTLEDTNGNTYTKDRNMLIIF